MKKFLVVLIFLFIFILNINPVKDPDFGWHYRCGKELIENNPCLTNTFSYFLPNYQSYYWSGLYDLLIAKMYDLAGFWFLAILQAGIITLIYWLYTKLTKQHFFISGLAFSTVIFFSAGTVGYGLRPQMLSFLFFITAYLFIKKIINVLQDNKKSVFSRKNIIIFAAYPLLIFIWVNTHIGFFTGIVLFVFVFIEYFIGYIYKKYSIRQLGLIFGVLTISILASFINPFGYKVYIEIYRHFVSPLNTMIAEWVAPPSVYIGIILVLTISILISGFYKKKFTLFDLVVLLYFAAITLMARRNVPLFFSISSIYALNIIPQIKFSKSLTFLALPFLGALFIAFSFFNVNSLLQFHKNWDSYCTKGAANYPCKTLKKYPQIHGNIYATYEIGGYLIWQRPDLKIFVDGRMPAWADENGKSPYTVYLEILQTQPGWNEKLRKLHTDYILIGRGTFLDLLLIEKAEEYGWKNVYEDKINVIYQNSLVY